LVGHEEVTQTSRCLFSFVTRSCPSQPFYALRATPKTALNFGWSIGRSVDRSVGWSVGWSCGSHMNITLPLQFRHPDPTFLTFLHPAGHPQNRVRFWSIGRSVSRLLGRSVAWSVGQGEVTRTSCCFYLFVTRVCPSQPFYALRATPKTALNFGRSVGPSVTGKSHECYATSSVSSPEHALPDPSTPCGPPPNWP
jgi:hypothetical protein